MAAASGKESTGVLRGSNAHLGSFDIKALLLFLLLLFAKVQRLIGGDSSIYRGGVRKKRRRCLV